MTSNEDFGYYYLTFLTPIYFKLIHENLLHELQGVQEFGRR